jgi:hypothetical protein
VWRLLEERYKTGLEAQQPRFRDHTNLLYYFSLFGARNPGCVVLCCAQMQLQWVISAVHECARVHTNVDMLSESFRNCVASAMPTARCAQSRSRFCRTRQRLCEVSPIHILKQQQLLLHSYSIIIILCYYYYCCCCYY